MALDDADTDEWTDVYVRVGNETHLASPNPDDDIADDADAVFQDNSPDGTRVWFGTDEPLVAEDQDLWYDLYEWAGVDGEVELLSTGPLDEPDPPDSEDQEFMDYEGSSDDGRGSTSPPRSPSPRTTRTTRTTSTCARAT